MGICRRSGSPRRKLPKHPHTNNAVSLHNRTLTQHTHGSWHKRITVRRGVSLDGLTVWPCTHYMVWATRSLHPHRRGAPIGASRSETHYLCGCWMWYVVVCTPQRPAGSARGTSGLGFGFGARPPPPWTLNPLPQGGSHKGDPTRGIPHLGPGAHEVKEPRGNADHLTVSGQDATREGGAGSVNQV
jgi:hypothetical protein